MREARPRNDLGTRRACGEFLRSLPSLPQGEVAIWHLADDGIQDHARWRARAVQYLELGRNRFAVSAPLGGPAWASVLTPQHIRGVMAARRRDDFGGLFRPRRDGPISEHPPHDLVDPGLSPAGPLPQEDETSMADRTRATVACLLAKPPPLAPLHRPYDQGPGPPVTCSAG